MMELFAYIGLIAIFCIGFFNLGCIISINTYGLNHMYEMFTWRGCWRSHPSLNEFGCLMVMIISYVFLFPCAILFWIARLFIRKDYF